MTNFVKLIIPCASKSYINNVDKGLIMNALAYFVFDLKQAKIIDQYIQIISTNFRMTDLKMIKTSYYKKPLVKLFRNNFLDKYCNNQLNNSDEIKHTSLNQLQINEVNKELKTMNTTIKTMFSLFSGSNIAGAETNNKASPIRCIDKIFFNCNFANVVKHYESNKKSKTKKYPNQIPELNLETFIEKDYISGFKKTFYKYNQELLFNDNNASQFQLPSSENEREQKKYQIVRNNIIFNPKEKQMLYINAILNKTIDQYDQLSIKQIDKQLRAYYNANVKAYIKEKYIPLHSTIEQLNLSVIENAHIIPFCKYKQDLSKEAMLEVINPFNCLRIDKNMHKLFDDHIIHFDDKGYLYDKNFQQVRTCLDIKNIPHQTIAFLKKKWKLDYEQYKQKF